MNQPIVPKLPLDIARYFAENHQAWGAHYDAVAEQCQTDEGRAGAQEKAVAHRSYARGLLEAAVTP